MVSRPFCRRVIQLAAVAAVAGTARAADPASGPPAGPRPSTGPVAAVVAGDPAIAAIREEGMNHSHVMETLDSLCNVIGQRLTGSLGQRHASEWTRDELARWGLVNAHLEPWGPFGRGWDLERYSLQVTAPYNIVLHSFPKAWSPGLAGDQPVEAEVVYLDARNRAGLAQYKGKLKGKIVLIGTARPPVAHFEAEATRYDEKELARMSAVKAAGSEDEGVAQMLRGGRSTTGPTAAAAASRPTSRPGVLPAFGAAAFAGSALAFAQAEGAVMVLDASPRGDGGNLFVAQASVPIDLPPTTGPTTAPTTGPTVRPRAWSPSAPAMPPQATLADEDFGRLVSLVKHGEKLKITAELKVKFTPADQVLTANTVAELPGTDLKDQLVLVGGHLDSWHSATGATDNAAGSACAMEAIRILKAAGLKPRRTVRVVLWTGEEEGLFGSAAYVKQHLGYWPEDPAGNSPASRPAAGVDLSNAAGNDGGANNPATRPAPTVAEGRRRRRATSRPTPVLVKGPEYDKVSAYFNLDNGTGKVRGIYAQGNTAAVPIFHGWLAPFADLSATTVTLSNTGSTDHVSFDRIGVPGFQFIQDPIEYFPRTHHSSADVFDRIQADDVKEASTVMAAMLWDAANADERFPRKPVVPPTPFGR